MKRQYSQILSIVAAMCSIVGVMMVFFVSMDINIISRDTNFTFIAAIVASATAATLSIAYSRINELKRKSRNIFIIYSNKDKEKVSEIVKQLKDMGYNPWIDYNEILPGQIWSEAIKDAISSSAVAIYVVSKNSYDDKYTSKELEIVKNEMTTRNKYFSPIIPIKIDDSEIPDMIKNIQYVDARDEKSFMQIDKSLKKILGIA